MELERRGYRCMTPKGSTSPILTFIYPSTSKLGPRLEAAQVEIALLDNCFRISPSVFNDLNDIERLIDALPQGAGSGGEIRSEFRDSLIRRSGLWLHHCAVLQRRWRRRWRMFSGCWRGCLTRSVSGWRSG